ncbi:MAG: Type 1 glutamine amidotransferase-like domain-containing protein [Planctomycetes bacterium]|nr:Type 1 glutamine amidotransferase-like domain-containing protein [Planctomycetota bacterium]
MPSVTLLGPQRLRPIVKPVLDEREIDGPLAVITGGWEEREDEVDDLRDHCQRETLNLGLHRRMEAVLNEDRALSQALTDRNDRLRVAQTFYQRRLAPLLDSVRRLHQLKVSRMELLPAERAHALLSVAELDAHYMTQIRGIHAAFQELWDPVARPAVVAAREELRELLAGSSALLIAGGHVGVLLDQLTLFELSSIVGDTPIVAWSAGAMVLCERIVLFHDSPPQGPGNAEVYDDGLGLAPQVVALPHARTRLKLSDKVRVQILAGRFAPASCVALDEGCGIHWDGQTWSSIGPARRLTTHGKLAGMVAP